MTLILTQILVANHHYSKRISKNLSIKFLKINQASIRSQITTGAIFFNYLTKFLDLGFHAQNLL